MSAPAASSDPLKLFVGGVPFAATEDDVTAWFVNEGLSKASVKNVELPTHADSGRKKGFAVVTFDSASTVAKATALDHKDMNGRYLNIRAYLSEPPARERPVKEKKPRKPRAPKADGGAPKEKKPRAPKDASASSSSAAPRVKKERKPREPRAKFVPPAGHKVVWVGNLPWAATEEEIAGLLSNGSGCTVRLGWDARRQRAKGFAHIEFETSAGADAAVGKNGVELGGRALRIDYAPERREEQKAE